MTRGMRGFTLLELLLATLLLASAIAVTAASVRGMRLTSRISRSAPPSPAMLAWADKRNKNATAPFRMLLRTCTAENFM